MKNKERISLPLGVGVVKQPDMFIMHQGRSTDIGLDRIVEFLNKKYE